MKHRSLLSRLTLGLLLANYSLLLLLPIPLSAQTITDEPPPPPPTDEPTSPPPTDEQMPDPTEDDEEEDEEIINPVGPEDDPNIDPDITLGEEPEVEISIDSNEPEEFSIELPEEVTGEAAPEPEAEITEEIVPEIVPEAEPETVPEAEAVAEPPQPTVPEPPVEFTFAEGAESSVNEAAGEAIADLSAGTFGDDAGIFISESQQQTLLSLLTGDPTNKSLFGDPLLNPLVRLLGQGGAGNILSWQLAKSLLGLLRGDKVNPKKLLAAVAAYNALIKASSDDFLLNPPAELTAIRAVLAELVNAAEAEYRTPE